MKKINVIALLLLAIVACKQETKEKKTVVAAEVTPSYTSFGDEIVAQDAVDAAKMENLYADLKPQDTLETKFTAEVLSVCPKKGCWMKLALPNGEEAMVRFKDYGFFVPKDIAGKEVVVNGLAYVTEMSVDEQRHYAEDAGKPQEEIDAIVAPKRTLGFEADGVLVAME